MFESCWFRMLCFLLVSSTAVSAEEFDIDSLQKRIYSTIKAVQPAVVSIGRGGSFSGVIVSKDGHILSAGHAVRPGVRYQILLPDGRRMTARGKGSNPQADCALLKITSDFDDLPFVQMGQSKSLVRNQPCLSLSFPGGQGARGIPLARFGRIVRTGGRGMLQSTALMEPGDSGGALFDLEGRVIGIHSRIGNSMSRNFEVPVDTFRKYWNELNREQSFTQSGPPVPKLGIRGRDSQDGTGLTVIEVADDTMAQEHGIETGDVIRSVYGRQTTSLRALRQALAAARDDKDADEIVVEILRGEQEVALKIPFDVDRDTAPEVELPDYDTAAPSKPEAIEELASLARQFSDMESELDDACVEISSQLSDGEELSILGTLVKATPFVISKNSMVANNPTASIADTAIELEVVARDNENDLVLLKAPSENSAGIEVSDQAGDIPAMGRFLITPDYDGAGLVSVVSTKAFASRKQQSRGYLGVVPEDYKDKGGAILREVNEGLAADRAGLKVGDVVIKLNDTDITTHMEMRRFLGTVDPNAIVVAQIIRDEEQLEKTIRLGAFPSFSNHAADQMNKSGRRDGFSQVISHDADLKPADCGGPIFDLNGNFVGLNIARNSRVRSYAIPQSIIKELLSRESNNDTNAETN